MTTVTENDLKELKDLINSRFDRLSEEINGLKIELATIKGELNGSNKRLENIEFTNRTIFIAIVAALLAGVVKLFFPSLPNTP
jgi:murein lipoprotein